MREDFIAIGAVDQIFSHVRASLTNAVQRAILDDVRGQSELFQATQNVDVRVEPKQCLILVYHVFQIFVEN